MEFLSLFAGIGGFDLGLERAGSQCVGQVEIDPFCTRVLERRWPDIHRWADVRQFDGQWRGNGKTSGSRKRVGLSRLDLLTGGFPCQDLSIAGKRVGLGGERSGLFWEFIRIAKETQPAWGIVENVPGLASSRAGRDLWAVIQGLRQCWPCVGWRVLDSQYWGVAQRRRRYFFVCGPDEASIASLLFESEGGGGNPPAGTKAGAGVAASLTSGSHRIGVNEPGRRRQDDMNLVAQALAGRDWRSTKAGDPLIIGSLTAHSERHGHAMTTQQAAESGQIITALQHLGCGGPDDDEAQGGYLLCDYAMDATLERHLDTDATEIERWSTASKPVFLVNAQLAEKQKTMIGTPLNSDSESLQKEMINRDKRYSIGVRRLTPVECERLQGFPDGWTCLCQPLEEYRDDPETAALRCRCPDGPRYRALGNAVTVNVAEWIGKRLIKG